jgi:mycothiol synthase
VSEPSVKVVHPEEFGAVRARVERIEAAAQACDGHASLNEAVWRDLELAPADSAGFLVDDAGYAHAARSDNFSPQHWAIGLALTPEARADGTRGALLGATLEHVATHGGGRAVLWMLGAPDDDSDIRATGFRPQRELHEMRVPLPLHESPRVPQGIEVRTFEPGRDESAWLVVNNRAFDNHPEQGGWIESTMQRRMREPWFDPSIFFLAFDAGGLAGSNWMKIHDAHGRDPRLGEIWVIGVDPRMQGSGLGRALAIIGLDEVARRGITTGSLFVAAENAPALGLYRALGFDIHRTDRAYECEVPA